MDSRPNDVELLGKNAAALSMRDVAPPLPDDLSLRDYLDVRLWPLERLSAQVEAISSQINAMQVALAGTITHAQYEEMFDRVIELEKQLAVQKGFGSGSRATWAVVVTVMTVVSGFSGAIIEALLRH